ncbi:MAG: class I SAM-dependent methyltransferase [Pirellulales bacterium]|nr:class I SAM-dependent methyltransferase [Pirellulales bacterium]
MPILLVPTRQLVQRIRIVLIQSAGEARTCIMEIIRGSLYDYPKYYDLLFGSDWKTEFDFIQGCFGLHARRPVRRLFEPACGTGRLLIKLAQASYEVAGNDLNPKAVAFCNARLARHGFPESAVVGDMADFRLRRKVDAAFNLINSFRHLSSEKAAESHLRCVADALAKGGLYLLGLHLTPIGPSECDQESWTAQQGRVSVVSQMQSIETDLRRRVERLSMTVDVHTPTRQFRLADEMRFRTYRVPQIRRLLGRIESLELVETYDFGYELNYPICLTDETEDVIFVLRKY